VGLEERAAIAKKARGDLFISIHFNSFAQAVVAGTETFVMTPRHQRSSPQRERNKKMVGAAFTGNRHDRWNIVLGYHIHRQLADKLKSVERRRRSQSGHDRLPAENC
jgi:N-acetylmuramoyl-L-alanine amidase